VRSRKTTEVVSETGNDHPGAARLTHKRPCGRELQRESELPGPCARGLPQRPRPRRAGLYISDRWCRQQIGNSLRGFAGAALALVAKPATPVRPAHATQVQWGRCSGPPPPEQALLIPFAVDLLRIR